MKVRDRKFSLKTYTLSIVLIGMLVSATTYYSLTPTRAYSKASWLDLEILPKNAKLGVNQSATFWVLIRNGTPTYTIEWMFEGERISSEASVTFVPFLEPSNMTTLMVHVTDSLGNYGFSSTTIYDPAVINVYLDDLPSQATYTIKTDGSGNFWSVRHDGYKAVESTSKTTTIQNTLNLMTSGIVWLKDMTMPTSGITIPRKVLVYESYCGRIKVFDCDNLNRAFVRNIPYLGVWHVDAETGDLSQVETQITGGGSGNIAVTTSVVYSGSYAINCSATDGTGGQKARIGDGIDQNGNLTLFGIAGQTIYWGGWFNIQHWDYENEFIGILDLRTHGDNHQYGFDSWIGWAILYGDKVTIRSDFPTLAMTWDFPYDCSALIGDWQFLQLGAHVSTNGWIKFWINGTLVASVSLDNSKSMAGYTYHRQAVLACESAWDNRSSYVACDVDSGDFKEGSKSATMDISSGFTTGLIATDVFSALEISAYRTFEFYIKSNVTLDAGDLQFVYDDTAACASPIETIDLPALPADVWTKVSLPKISIIGDNLAVYDAIISVGLNATRDFGICQIKIDDVDAVELPCSGVDKVLAGISPIGGGTGYCEVIIDDLVLSEVYITSP